MWPFKLHRDQAALVRMRQSRDYWKTRALTAERQRDASWDLSSQQSRVIREQGTTVAKLREELVEATGPNAVTADNQRLAKELAQIKAEQLACRTGLCDWANDLRSQQKATVAELHRERRLRDQHAATCPTAEAIADHVEDKDRENAS